MEPYIGLWGIIGRVLQVFPKIPNKSGVATQWCRGPAILVVRLGIWEVFQCSRFSKGHFCKSDRWVDFNDWGRKSGESEQMNPNKKWPCYSKVTPKS